MLLLVLILVLIAFGLLLVGFLSSSVMWAWVSVAVSVAAAMVLLFDTVQRRSVVKAGDESGGEASPDDGDTPPDRPTPDSPTTVARYPDAEPVTEVIPIVRSSAFGPPQVGYGMQGAPLQGAPVGRRGSGVEPRFDPDTDSQQTVMMPAVQPPGSATGPSGATQGFAPSSEPSSPTVTVDRSDPPGATSEDESADGPVDPPEISEIPETADTPADRSGAGVAAATVVVPAAGASASPSDERAAPGDPAAPADAVDEESTVDGGADAPPRAPEAAGVVGDSGPGSRSPETDVPARADAVSEAAATADETTVTQARGPQAQEPSTPAEVPTQNEVAVTDGEVPEERPPAAAAALVAALDDEVLVIDEKPRYHVPGCRTLLAAPLIPLPAGEAVELGFTPCGWCTPVRTLSSRYPAAAR